MSEVGGQLVIFGKIGHPEVLGLMGQVNSDVVVIQNIEQLKSMVESGHVRTDRSIELFSQTTMSPEEYQRVSEYLSSSMQDASLVVHDTICSQVAFRHRELVDFAKAHDVIVFVSGQQSSNGKVLYELCRRTNRKSYHISSSGELAPEWFAGADRVGVCGATSTPKWLLENVAMMIENLH